MRHIPSFIFSLALLASCAGNGRGGDGGTIKADVCIYGGTSAAVTAARAAAEEGCKVVVICPDTVLGGMTTGGLGATDIGNKQAIIGMARQFYRDLGAHYGKNEQWTFEPSVAQGILDGYLDHDNISVHTGCFLESVAKKGTVIRSVTCTGGEGSKTVKAKVFIDATYEGDLMAMAGVSYHVGREDESVYGEHWNGSHLSVFHQFPDGVDPFVEKGNPASGLLWGIQDWTIKEEGKGDGYVQAYNYRICMSRDKDNQIPITRPADYDSTKYELLARVFEADPDPDINNYFIWSLMPGGKTDINNRGPFSTDMIGMNHDYPEASWERRREIIEAHRSYTLGLFYFYATDPRVPKNLQDWINEWGYAKDEYPSTGGWTHQLYVREARRMVGEYVATQADCEGRGNVQDGIGYAAYQMDSHNCERVVVEKDGKLMVKNEGDVEIGGGKPYPISYRSVTPKREECTNLLVPVCISASHIAYGSIRMEPVFLELGQVCGLAAAFAGRKPVQTIDITRIQEKVGYVVCPNKIQQDWAEAEIGVLLHMDMQVFKPDYNWRNYGSHPDPDIFNPTELDTDQWMGTASRLGAKYAVLVAKHGSGFSLWPTEAHDYSVKNTAWRDGKGDIVADFVASCKKYGIRPGIYANTNANGYLHTDRGITAKGGPVSQTEYNAVVAKQLTELWSNYGDLFEIWFDGGVLTPKEGGADVLPLVKELQPDAIAFQGPLGHDNLIRWVGNEQGTAPDPCWATADSTTNSDGVRIIEGLHGRPDAPFWCPGESDFTLRYNSSFEGGWMWHEGQDSLMFSVDELMEKYETSVGRNTNMLLGVVIDSRGLIPDADVSRITEFGKAIRARYGTPSARTSGKGERITLKLKSPASVDRIILQEDISKGERVLAWHLEGVTPSGETLTLCDGTNIGHKRIARFEPVELASLTLVVDASKAVPFIRNFAVFNNLNQK